MLTDVGNNLFSFTLMFSLYVLALYLNIERELIMTKCGPHIFPYFFSESSWCQQHGIEEKKRQKDHMPFDRKLSVSVDHDRECVSPYCNCFVLPWKLQVKAPYILFSFFSSLFWIVCVAFRMGS
jgi:hypothetical protein